jgi:hypothetical protein
MNAKNRWAEDVANRERIDALVKQSFIDGMSKSRPSTKRPSVVVTVRELADELRMDRSACRRYVLRLGYKPVKQRTASSGFQEALTLTREEADAIVAFRRREGY